MNDKVWFVLVILCMISLGWFGNDLYRFYMNKRTVNGIWTGAETKHEALEQAYSRDSVGNWVCVNIDGMSYRDMVTTCEHEVGHEMFAQGCEGNITKCLEAVK